MRLLIIEDDREASSYLSKAFREAGHVADTADARRPARAGSGSATARRASAASGRPPARRRRPRGRASSYLSKAFREAGHVADTADDGLDGYALAREGAFTRSSTWPSAERISTGVSTPCSRRERISDSPSSGYALAREGAYDVLVVDRMLPKLDGLSLIRSLREQGVAGLAEGLGQVAGRLSVVLDDQEAHVGHSRAVPGRAGERREGAYDVLVVDRMLPKLDGLSLIRSLREQGVETSVAAPPPRRRARTSIRAISSEKA
jgi:DNA-binding response OmpR family regulator